VNVRLPLEVSGRNSSGNFERTSLTECPVYGASEGISAVLQGIHSNIITNRTKPVPGVPRLNTGSSRSVLQAATDAEADISSDDVLQELTTRS